MSFLLILIFIELYKLDSSYDRLNYASIIELEEMESTQGRTGGSPARRLPFLETVEQLHQYNLRVAEVCFNTSQASVEAYNSKKQIFKKEAG